MSVLLLWFVTVAVGVAFLISAAKGDHAAADPLAAITFGLALTCAILMFRNRLRSGRW